MEHLHAETVVTPQARRALNTLKRLADQLEPRARYAYRSALERLQLGADLSRVERALQRGNVDDAIAALLPPEATAEFEHALTVAIAHVVADVGPRAAKEIASTLGLRFQFVPGSPSAAAAMQRMNLSSIVPVTTDAEAGLRAVLVEGLRAGDNPIALAREAKSFVGLTPYDAELIQSFEEQLRTDPASALTRTLRDKRFDSTIAKSIDGPALSDAQIGTMTQRYTSALKDWRSETWSRTTTLKAVRETQLAAWQQVADDFGMDEGRMVKTWVTTLDGHERDSHHALHGDTVPLDEVFSNGDMIPGDGTGIEGEEFGCRCSFTVRVLPRDAGMAAQFVADREAMLAE